ncbi:MAG: PrsW family intramembrane metalloprotease [Anaerolineae bacterium]|nr:MAG: PrsW family intramembrane metalloprotease [Anaerolineae bacterium]
MKNHADKPNQFFAYAAMATGVVLLTSGVVAVVGYLGLPLLLPFEDVLSGQLGIMAAIFLGLGGGSLALVHGLAAARNRVSRPVRLPSPYAFWLTFALVLGLGNLVLNINLAREFLFPPLFALGAALPTFAVLAWTVRRLGSPVTWRQASLMLVSGGTVSILVTFLLGSIMPFIFYLLVEPLEEITLSVIDLFIPSGPGFLERLLFSPELVFFLIIVAMQAPIPEEFAKALGPGFLRSNNEGQAFLVGMFSGAGFAIVENMLYESVYASWSGWSWGGVTAIRGIGSVLHLLGTGIIALALYRERQRGVGWFGRVAKAYLISVGLHTLWNGGFDAFLYLSGLEYYGGVGPSLSVYGLYVEGILVVYLTALSAGLWWLLRRIAAQLEQAIPDVDEQPLVSRRALAVWATACVMILIPIGAALGRAWGPIQELILGR